MKDHLFALGLNSFLNLYKLNLIEHANLLNNNVSSALQYYPKLIGKIQALTRMALT